MSDLLRTILLHVRERLLSRLLALTQINAFEKAPGTYGPRVGRYPIAEPGPQDRAG